VVLERRPDRARNDAGVTILLVAMSVVTLFGMAAFVVDHGFARQTTRNEQSAADAGALAAAQDLPKGATPNGALSDVARSVARSYTGQSLAETPTGPACAPGAATCTFTAGVHTVTVTTPYALAGSSIPSHNLVYVQACRALPSFFSGVFGDDVRTVCRSSVARNRNIVSGFGRGLIALNPTACRSLEFSGSSSTNLYSDGAIIVESNCPTNALDGGGNAWDVFAGLITVVGGVDISPCSIPNCLNGTTPTTGVTPSGDPLAGVPEPARPANAPATSAGTDESGTAGSTAPSRAGPGARGR